jgi:hypothetical protein
MVNVTFHMAGAVPRFVVITPHEQVAVLVDDGGGGDKDLLNAQRVENVPADGREIVPRECEGRALEASGGVFVKGVGPFGGWRGILCRSGNVATMMAFSPASTVTRDPMAVGAEGDVVPMMPAH